MRYISTYLRQYTIMKRHNFVTPEVTLTVTVQKWGGYFTTPTVSTGIM